MTDKKSKILRWAITIGVVVVAAVLIWVFVIKAPKAKYESPLSPVEIAKPYRADVNQQIVMNGYVQADAMIPVVPFVAGTITGYYAKAGDYVNEGDVLAQIDSKPYQLQVDQANAVYLAALATWTRVQNLYSSGSATKQNYDEAKAQVDAYKAQLDLANVQLDYATVTAPISGTILTADSAEGSVGVTTSPLYVMADLNNLKIVLDVSEKYFDLITENRNNITAVITRDGATASAHVDNVAPYVTPESKTFKVTLKLDGDVSKFRPGMYVKVSMVYNTMKNALVIDQKTRNSDGTTYTYDMQTGKAKFADIKEVATDEKHIAIEEKWADSWFIVDGQGNVLDGQNVNAINK